MVTCIGTQVMLSPTGITPFFLKLGAIMHKFTEELKKDLTRVFSSFSYEEYSKMFIPTIETAEELAEFLSESGDKMYSQVLKLHSPIQEVFCNHGF